MRKKELCISIALFIVAVGFRLHPEKEKKIVRSFAETSTFPNFHNDNDSTARRIFFSSCNSCHKDSAALLAPGISVMALMTPRAIVASLTSGKMRQQGASLSVKERTAIAEWITKTRLTSTTFSKQAYTTFSLAGNSHSFDHWGWGNNKEGNGFRTTTQAGISPENVGSLKLKWAFAFPEATLVRSKPAIVGDWIITGSQFGDVFALNRSSGKIGWHFTAGAGIRGAISIVQDEKSLLAVFADYTTNVYAVDIKTGKLVWKKRAGFDPQSSNTGSVTIYNGKIFVPISSIEVASALKGDYKCCVSSGGVVAMDVKTGKKIWQHRILPVATASGKTSTGKSFYGPSGAPVWCSPTIDSKRGLLYIGTGQNYSYPSTNTSDAILALNINTGKMVWHFQATSGDMYNVACPYFNNCPDVKSPDFDFGMAPILIKKEDGSDILVVGQKSGLVYALSPGSGKVIWKTRVGKGGKLGGIHWGMATDKKRVYAPNSDNIYAVDKSDSTIDPSPGIYALDLVSGGKVWNTPTPLCSKKDCLTANSAAPLVIPGVLFAGALDGHVRAYSTETGKILWDYDTAIEYEGVNGVKGKGGAIDGPAAVVSGGMLLVNSGYGMFGQMPGNVLLAFEIDKQ